MTRTSDMRGFLLRNRVELLLFAAFWFSFACVQHARPGWNVNSRLDLAFALVDLGTFSIDAYHDRPFTRTQDKAFFEGHYYSDKSPALSLLAAPFYALAKPFLSTSDPGERAAAARQWCTAWTVGLLGAVAAVLFHRLMRSFGASGREALVLTALLFWGTNLGGYTSLFYAYLPATACILGAYVLGLSARSATGESMGRGRAAVIGLLISLAGFFEFTFGLAGLVLLALTFATVKPRSRFGWVVAGAIPPLIALLAYSYSIFGELTLAYSHESKAVFRRGISSGLMGIGRPDPVVLYYTTIHPYKGIFFYSPFLLFFFVGSLRARAFLERWRPDLVAAWAILFGYLAFNSSYYMWWGGWSMGPRHMVGMLPFLFLPILAAMRHGAALRSAVLVTGGIAVLLNLPVILVDPQIPSGHSFAKLAEPEIAYDLSSRWLTQRLPEFLRGEIADVWPLATLPGHWPLVPLLLVWTATAAAAWRWSR
jgi:hypothetical protein